MKKTIEYILKISLLVVSVFLLLNCSKSTGVFKSEGGQEDNISHATQALEREPEFTLGPGDILTIKVYRHDDLSLTSVRIRLDGKFTYPLIGEVEARGKTVKTLEAHMMERFKEYIVNPMVMVNPTALTSKKAIVAGEVTTPSVLTMEENMTLLQVIHKCGGFTADADKSGVTVIRDGKTAIFDLKKALKGDAAQNIYIRADDIVFVPSTFMADLGDALTRISKIISFIVQVESGIILTPDVIDILKKGKKSTSTGFSISN
ncbi:MAG: polysaccharide export protein [Nitrospirae bacterium YQR-1]